MGYYNYLYDGEVLEVRATIAGHTFELIGCDAMHNADKFLRFPCEQDAVDCRIEVIVQKERAIPLGQHLDQTGDWRRFAIDGGVQVCHRNRTIMFTMDEAFEQIQILLSTDMPQMDTVLYLQVQQMICSYLLLHGGSLIHSAGMRVENSGFLLCGRSGVGKSTMARHLQKLDSRMTVLSEDMPAVVCAQDGFTLYGTPLCGDDVQCENACASLERIVVLRQASQNRLVMPSKAEGIYELLTVVPRLSYATDVATAATDLLVTMASKLPIVIFENDGTCAAAQMLLTYLQTEPRE